MPSEWVNLPPVVMKVPGIRVSGVATVEEPVVEVLRHAVVASRAREMQMKKRRRVSMTWDRRGFIRQRLGRLPAGSTGGNSFLRSGGN
jgi:hypothetical protein